MSASVASLRNVRAGRCCSPHDACSVLCLTSKPDDKVPTRLSRSQHCSWSAMQPALRMTASDAQPMASPASSQRLLAQRHASCAWRSARPCVRAHAVRPRSAAAALTPPWRVAARCGRARRSLQRRATRAATGTQAEHRQHYGGSNGVSKAACRAHRQCTASSRRPLVSDARLHHASRGGVHTRRHHSAAHALGAP